MLIQSGIGLGLKLAVVMVALIPLEASNSSSDILCLQHGLIFQRVFLFPLSAPTCL